MLLDGASYSSKVGAQTLSLDYYQQDAGEFPKVISKFKLSTSDGRFFESLSKNKVRIFENSVLQAPFTLESFGGGNDSVSVVLVVDVSRSMAGELTDAKKAASSFVDLLDEKDEAALVAFWDQPETKLNFTRDKKRIRDAITALTLGDKTALYDAILLSAKLIRKQAGRRAIVLLSDGKDNNSTASFDDTKKELLQLGVPLYSIGLGISDGLAIKQLKELSRLSNGLFFASPTTDDLREIYAQIAQLIDNQYYQITYSTSDCVADGSMRDVRIEVQHDGDIESQHKSYNAPGHYATLEASPPLNPAPGTNISVKIAPSDGSLPPSDLKMLKLKVYFSSYLRPLIPVNTFVVAGQYWGNENDYTKNVSYTPGSGFLNIELTKSATSPAANGGGHLFDVLFNLAENTPDSSRLEFSVEIVDSRDSKGCAAALKTAETRAYSDGFSVWPGDTNQNGSVEITDVLELGLHWERKGPPRPQQQNPIIWRPHLAKRFNPREATYADTDGSGTVDEKDIVPVALHWGKTTMSWTKSAPNTVPLQPTSPGTVSLTVKKGIQSQQFAVWINYNGVSAGTIAGFTFRLKPLNSSIRITGAAPGNIWEQAPLQNADYLTNGTFAAGFTSIAGQPVKQQGTIAVLNIEAPFKPTHKDFQFVELYAVDVGGNFHQLEYTTAAIEEGTLTIKDFKIGAAYPNPFNPATRINLDLPEPATVEMTVFNILGQRILTTRRSFENRGTFNLRWDGRDFLGKEVSAGIYFIEVIVKGEATKPFQRTRRITLLR